MNASADALKHFQDRDAAIAAFDTLWDDSRHWILAFDGMSGHGKSTLIRWLEVKRCEPLSIPHAITDFYTWHSDHQVLSGILRSMHAWLPQDSYQHYQQESKSILSDLAHQRHQIQIRQEQSGGEGNIQSVNLNLAEDWRKAEEHARQRLAEVWLACLEDFAYERLVLFFDTFERYQERAPQGEQDWLWATLEEARKIVSGLRVVVGSRMSVRGVSQGLAEQALEELEQKDSDALLKSMCVTDAEFRAAVYNRLAKGHPGVTEFAANAWLDAQRCGTPLTAAQIPTVAALDEAIEWIQGKIIDRLEEPLKSAVRWMALLRHFNLEIINATLPLDVEKLTIDHFEQLRRYPFVQRKGEYWSCHDLLRQVQFGYLHRVMPEAFAAFHQQAQAYFIGKDNLEALYHQFFYAPEAAFALWREQQKSAAFWLENAERLFGVVENSELRLTDEDKAEVLYRHGQHYYYLSENEKCRRYYKEALSLFEAVGDPRGKANVMVGLADLERLQDNPEAARQHYQAALFLYKEVDMPLGKANVLRGLGHLESRLGNLEVARQHYQATLPLYEAVDDSLGKANVLNALGDLERRQDNLEVARQHYQAALPLYEAVNAPRGNANVLCGLGDLERQRGNAEAARQHFQAALLLFEAVSERHGKANVLVGLGRLESSLNNPEAARQHYQAALPLFEAVDDSLGKASVMLGLGELEANRGNPEAARQHYQAALPLFEKGGNLHGKANLLRGLGHLESRLGNRGCSLFGKIRFPSLISTLYYFILQLIYQSKGTPLKSRTVTHNPDDARQYFQEALPLYEAVDDSLGKANVLVDLGDLERQQGNLETARQHFQEALPLYEAVDDSLGKANVLNALGDLERQQGNLEMARQHFLAALPLFEKVGDLMGQVNTFMGLGRIERSQKNRGQADEYFMKGLTISAQVINQVVGKGKSRGSGGPTSP